MMMRAPLPWLVLWLWSHQLAAQHAWLLRLLPTLRPVATPFQMMMPPVGENVDFELVFIKEITNYVNDTDPLHANNNVPCAQCLDKDNNKDALDQRVVANHRDDDDDDDSSGISPALQEQLDDAAKALHVLPVMAMFPIFWESAQSARIHLAVTGKPHGFDLFCLAENYNLNSFPW